ncbi:MAG: TVP38/TMEM64 family protein [Proteobacteria bacterium]|nr:TVP38/TMEM64 family protein [Pseudomonadota bacterium]
MFIKPLGLLLGLVIAGVVLKTLAGGLKGGLLAEYVVGHGIEGEAFFVAAGALLCAAGLPRQAVAFAGGYAFGLKLGLVLAMVAQVLGCVTDFFWARSFARDWVQGRIGARLARLDAQLSAQPFMASLALRLLPVGNNVALSLLAGLSSVSAPAFLVASAVGYVPQTLVFALLGSGVQVSHTTQIVLGGVLFVASALFGIVLMRRWKPAQPQLAEARPAEARPAEARPAEARDVAA